ncbi:hypothetical protein Asp14428_22640 [Actinoplanes sp. NBRC 14428]|nr:hypothetical protein Asp14428_22640 [Actinoplanes sp. NBRC 14428]
MSDGGAAERERLAQADSGEQPWRAWGPYVAERAWGTVREDYSEHGTAWDYFPHDHARSRAYRWNDDGMAGVCDDRQTFCFALALWNGRDPILKERMFGLGGDGGNHGEDAKEYWWYQDSTPTHSWMTWRYHYPQSPFPYDELVAVNGRRSREEPEYELVDTGVFDDDRFWAVTVDYAKAAPRDLCMVITVANRGPDEATLHVLPTLWFRNTWSWGLPNRAVPVLTGTPGRLAGEHRSLGHLTLAGEGEPEALMCDNETNSQRLWGCPARACSPRTASTTSSWAARPPSTRPASAPRARCTTRSPSGRGRAGRSGCASPRPTSRPGPTSATASPRWSGPAGRRRTRTSPT